MKPETVCTVVFSPTGTSKKIAEAVARGITSGAGAKAAALKTIDLTHAAAQSAVLPAGAVAVIAAPVYGGHVAPTAAKRLETLRGSGTPAVVIAVYGNRAFEKAAAELAALAARQGFVPVAAAAFVGEHSYSTPETPSPRDVPTRRISPGPRSSAPRCAKSSRRERRPRSTPRN